MIFLVNWKSCFQKSKRSQTSHLQMDFNKHDSNSMMRLGRFNWEDMLTTVSTSQLHNRHPKIKQVTQPPSNHKGTKPQTIILLANSSSSGDSLLQGRPLLQQFHKPACQLVTPSCKIHRERPQLLPIKEKAIATRWWFCPSRQALIPLESSLQAYPFYSITISVSVFNSKTNRPSASGRCSQIFCDNLQHAT